MLSKLPDTGTTIFSVMSSMAAEYGAINLSQGFPNYSSQPRLFELVKKYMDGGYNQYALMQGALPLREAIAVKVRKCHSRSIDPETEVCITAGATQAVYTAIQAVVHPGDDVIVFDPAFDIYVPSVQLAGGRAVRIPLSPPRFGIDWQRVRDAITPRTKAVILNSPHNPTGAVLNDADISELKSLVSAHDLYIISDEVYEHLVFDGSRHESMLLYDELYERCIACFSFGKTFHNTGWKVGYAIAPPPIMAEFRNIHQWIVFSVNHPVQHALAEYMKDESTYLELPEFYQAKRDLFLDQVRDSRFTFTASGGTYFQLLDYSGISGKNDRDFAGELVVEHGIASIPISPFCEHDPGYRLLRFCFAKTSDILELAGEKLCRI
jgi:methionine aminotransferase